MDAGRDGGTGDAGTSDGAPRDATASPDSGARDGATADAPDAPSATETGVPDAPADAPVD
jgi:hypothetical protein